MTSPRLLPLAEFAAVFEAPDFKAAEGRPLLEATPEVILWRGISYSAPVEAFVAAAYEHGWVLRSFDWPNWARSADAIRLRDDESALAAASEEQLMQLLTVCIRQDRFAEGALLAAFESGLIRRIVRRAVALSSQA
jgi:hypothetical protein